MPYKQIPRGRQKSARFFRDKTVDLNQYLHDYYLKDGAAHISCHIQHYAQVINPYSVPGYEDLSPEFAENIQENAQRIPPEYPISLEIYGGAFSPKEQRIIRETITDHFALKLGDLQLSQDARARRAFRLLAVCFVILGLRLCLPEARIFSSSSFLAMIFLEVFLEGIFSRMGTSRLTRIHAEQMANIQVVFQEQSITTP